MSKIGDLFVRLGIKKDEFTKGIQQAKNDTEGFTGKLKSMAGVAKVAWAAVAAAVVKFATDAVKMTQKWGDQWNVAMAGVKAAYGSFVRQLASGEGFDNLFANMREAARLAREAAQELDEVFERTVSYDYTAAQTEKEIAQLQLIMRDSSKSDKERLDAANQIIKKTEELAQLKKDINEQEAAARKKELQSQTQLNDDEIQFLVREYNQNKDIINQGRQYLNERRQAQKDKTWLSIGSALDDTPGGSPLTQMRDDAAQKVRDLDAATSQAVKDVAAVLEKYDKGNDELIAGLAKAEVAVINVDTEMYRAQMRATALKGSITKSNSGSSSSVAVTDPAAEQAAKIQQRAEDAAKSEIQLLAEKYEAEKNLLQQYGIDATALTAEYEANTLKVMQQYSEKTGASAEERAALLREAYQKEKADLAEAGLDTTTLVNTVFEELLRLEDEATQEFIDKLNEDFPVELDPIEIDDTELNSFVENFQASVDRAQDIATQFGDAVAAGFSDACQEMFDQLMGLEESNPGAIIKALLQPLAQMAVKMGEVIMAEGIAMAAAKKALANPYTAIAAGAALIAIGTAAMSALSALASSGGASSTTTASASGYTGGSSSNSTQTIETEMTIYVKGRLSGSDIVLSGQKTVNQWSR